MQKPESIRENQMPKIIWEFDIETYYLMDFAVTTDYRVKIKEVKKIDKYLCSIKVTVVLILGALGIVPEGLESKR